MAPLAANPDLPIIVIGSGPMGLAMAAHLVDLGLEPLVLEAGSSAGANVADWNHVRLFTPWRYCVDPVASKFLLRDGWSAPSPNAFLTGADLLERHLLPLSRTPELAGRIRVESRVLSVSRLVDKLSGGYNDAPFEVVVKSEGGEARLLGSAVVDASGSYASPNRLGAGSRTVEGEVEAAEHVSYRIPNLAGVDQERFMGKRVAVVGAGHSSYNALLELAPFVSKLTWITRRTPNLGPSKDILPERQSLSTKLASLVQAEAVTLASDFITRNVVRNPSGFDLRAMDGRAVGPFDEIVVLTGFRPDLSMLSELQIAVDPVTEAPIALAPEIDPRVHTCGSVRAHGARELEHPDKGFYVVGMKSYGRAPTFLLTTGYGQVQSVARVLAGLPEADEEEQGCCGAVCCC